jgi:hypothetical protein
MLTCLEGVNIFLGRLVLLEEYSNCSDKKVVRFHLYPLNKKAPAMQRQKFISVNLSNSPLRSFILSIAL